MSTHTIESSSDGQHKSAAYGTNWQGAPTDNMSAGTRMRGARLAAGYVRLQDAAELFDVPANELAATESGALPIEGYLLQLLPVVYGVSPAFPYEGPDSEREQVAMRLARIIALASTDSGERRKWWPKRLARIRQMVAAVSDDALRSRLHWLHPYYNGAETSADSDAGLDLQIGLCLALGGMPEFGVLSELPAVARPGSETPWWRALRSEDFAYLPLPVESSDWSWLRHASSGACLVIQIVDFDGHTFSLSTDKPLRVPRSALPAATAPAGASIYGVRFLHENQRRIAVLDPERGDGDCLLVDELGLGIGVKSDWYEPTQDPMGYLEGDEASGSLGALVAWLKA